jgi:hypothetical protein
MNKNLLICGILFLLVVLVLSACIESQSQSSEEMRFVGTWDMEGTEVTINLLLQRLLERFPLLQKMLQQLSFGL